MRREEKYGQNFTSATSVHFSSNSMFSWPNAVNADFWFSTWAIEAVVGLFMFKNSVSLQD
jgi:hypothetical protein